MAGEKNLSFPNFSVFKQCEKKYTGTIRKKVLNELVT